MRSGTTENNNWQSDHVIFTNNQDKKYNTKKHLKVNNFIPEDVFLRVKGIAKLRSKAIMLKPELNDLPTEFSENFRLFGDVCISVYYLFIYSFFNSFIFQFLKWPRSHRIVYFIFYHARSAQKVFQEL